MNILNPISSIMTSELLTVNPEDKLKVVKKIFDENKIHHLPVVKEKKLVGIISSTDIVSFLHGLKTSQIDNPVNDILLKNHTVETIMTTGVAKLSSTDKINVALEVFKENLFHAIPVVDDNELVGIVTTYDIINGLSQSN